MTPDYAIDAVDLMDAMRERDAAARALEDANRKAAEALRKFEAAADRLALVRSKVAERFGMTARGVVL